MVCVPKPEGGLGVLDLKIQTESLLRKHLHKFFNRMPVPWVQLVWDRYISDLIYPQQVEHLGVPFGGKIF